jgi:exonuclease VII large subunit
LPIFRLSRTFGVGRNVKVFLNLQGALTRGAVPDLEHHPKQAEQLSKALRNQRKTLKRKDQQIEEQAEQLRKERQRNHQQKRELRQKGAEIFQLRNKLDAINGLVENSQDAPSAPQLSGEPKIGALPDFVIIGAQRCGTSSLYRVLTQHPDIERPAKKEIHYFDRPEQFKKGTEWYRLCFSPPKWKDGRKTITGEATPMYLFDPLVPERMAQVIPQARLIVLLRNPVDRAYSHYHHNTRLGHVTRTFEEGVEEELARLLDEENEASKHERQPNVASNDRPPNLLARGIYVDQLLRWRRFFSDEQMLVLKSEDFFKHTTDTLKLVQDFLNLPHHKLDRLPRRTKKYDYESMDPATRRRLEDYFEPHNQRLYEYLGVDFGW